MSVPLDRRVSRRRNGATYRSREVGAGNALNGGVEVVERLRLDDLSTDLRADTKHGEATLDRDEAVRLLDRSLDGVNVQRTDRPQVDDLGLDAFLLLEDLGSLHRKADHARVTDDGHVLADALNLCLSDREEEVGRLRLLRDRERLAVQNLVLENDDRVRVTDGSLRAIKSGRSAS